MVVMVGIIGGVIFIGVTVLQWNILPLMGNWGVPVCGLWVLFSALCIGVSGAKKVDRQMKAQEASESIVWFGHDESIEYMDVEDTYMD